MPISTPLFPSLNGAFFSRDQRCTAYSRLILTEGIHDRFVARLTDEMAKLKIGHALDADTNIGPVVNQGQLDQDLEYIGIGKSEGAKLFDGECVRRSTEGFFLSPVLFTGATNDMRISGEEIFGPVASVIRVRDFEEALATANDTDGIRPDVGNLHDITQVWGWLRLICRRPR